MNNENQAIDISQLTAEQLEQLSSQLKAKEKEEAAKKEADREALAKLEDEAVEALFKDASAIANSIGAFKLEALTKFQPLMAMKVELAKAANDQKSYTFLNAEKKKKIIIAYNEVWATDDGIHACIGKVKEWMKEISSENEAAAPIVGIVEKLISSKDGAYSVDGIWDFINAAKEIDSPLLKEAAEAGRRSLFKKPSSVSVKVYSQEKTGWEQLPLSATKA